MNHFLASRRSLLAGLSVLALLPACSGRTGEAAAGSVTAAAPPPPPPVAASVIKGFNQNWSMLPALDTPGMISLIKQLHPAMLRYPGGTVTHSWDWRIGHITTRGGGVDHPLTDVKAVADATGARFSIVLDIINSPLDDQIEMLAQLRRIGVPFRHVELGNEVYAQDDAYMSRFPSGSDYATEANVWIKAIRARFPDMLIAPVLFARQAGPANPRGQTWNADVLGALKEPVDGYTMHLYIPVGGTAADVMANFDAQVRKLALTARQVWITEYGNQNHGGANYLTELLALAEAVESHPAVALALNHQIIGGNKSKISADGLALTAEGTAFARRPG